MFNSFVAVEYKPLVIPTKTKLSILWQHNIYCFINQPTTTANYSECVSSQL
jgi:hypothetical protein